MSDGEAGLSGFVLMYVYLSDRVLILQQDGKDERGIENQRVTPDKVGPMVGQTIRHGAVKTVGIYVRNDRFLPDVFQCGKMLAIDTRPFLLFVLQPLSHLRINGLEQFGMTCVPDNR